MAVYFPFACSSAGSREGGNRRLFLSCVQPCCTNVLAQQWRFKTIETPRSNIRYGVLILRESFPFKKARRIFRLLWVTDEMFSVKNTLDNLKTKQSTAAETFDFPSGHARWIK